jgi:tRNA(Met) C34 N-acetyltransferase TmcA
MSAITHTQTPASSIGSVALAIGAVMVTGQAYWPAEEAPTYVINQTVPSYSEVSEKIIAATKIPHSTFVDQMASIYASFSERQELLGEEFEAAIFDDLDSLYES